jgi:hypothetical protein
MQVPLFRAILATVAILVWTIPPCSWNRDLIVTGTVSGGVKLRDRVALPTLTLQVKQTATCQRPNVTIPSGDSRLEPRRCDGPHSVTIIDADARGGAAMNTPYLAMTINSQAVGVGFGQPILCSQKRQSASAGPAHSTSNTVMRAVKLLLRSPPMRITACLSHRPGRVTE